MYIYICIYIYIYVYKYIYIQQNNWILGLIHIQGIWGFNTRIDLILIPDESTWNNNTLVRAVTSPSLSPIQVQRTYRRVRLQSRKIQSQWPARKSAGFLHPKNGWFIMEHPNLKFMIWGYPHDLSSSWRDFPPWCHSWWDSSTGHSPWFQEPGGFHDMDRMWSDAKFEWCSTGKKTPLRMAILGKALVSGHSEWCAASAEIARPAVSPATQDSSTPHLQHIKVDKSQI